jgi:hypothetical protein
MSWLYSQALVAAYSEDISLDGEQCALWNGTHTQRASWLPAKTTDACRLFRFGMTCRPLTEENGAGVLMSFLAAFPARISRRLERAPASKASEAVCGSTWRESSVKYCRDSCSWKTHQCLWEEDLEWSSVTLPRWGMMRDGVLWERITSALPTNGTGSGLWPAPKASTGGPDFAKMTGRDNRPIGPGISLATMAALRQWPTPRSQDAKHGTPTDWELTTEHEGTKGSLRVRIAKDMWPTPCSNEDSYRLNGDSQQSRSLGALARQEALSESVTSGGQLNPAWVEWLMGWPIDWTALDPQNPNAPQLWCDPQGWEIDPAEYEDESQRVPRTAHKVAKRVGRLKCIGNGQVPLVAATAWLILTREDTA